MGRHVALQEDRPGVVSRLTPDRRKALYGVVAAVQAALTAAGVVTGEQASMWRQVGEHLAAIITLLVAVLHTGGVYEAPVITPEQQG